MKVIDNFIRSTGETGDPETCFELGVPMLSDDKGDYTYHNGLELIMRSAAKKYPPAMHASGRELLFGKRIPKDEELGIKLIKDAAEQGYIPSIRFLYSWGEEEVAVKCAQKFADENVPEAITTLAIFKFYDECADESLSLLLKAASLGDREAMRHLGSIYEKEEMYGKDAYKAALWYNRAAESGDAEAMTFIASLLLNGPEEMRNERAAFEWYLKAAEAGQDTAWNDVANCYKLGIGVNQSFEKALEYYLLAAESENPEDAYYNLYLLYSDGNAADKNMEEALKWLRKAAVKGVGEACITLGLLYRAGIVVDRSDLQAYLWLKIAADNGYLEAVYEIGEMYLNSDCVDKDEKKGFECFEQASDLLPIAMRRLGNCYSSGIGCEQDFQTALQCYKSAAADGDVEAMFDLGVCYRRGEGVTVDIERAIEWYEEAISQGHTGAMVNCGILFDKGIGVEIDLARAYQLYKQAAEAGNAEAQFCLGSMFFCGRHVQQNYVEAVKWFSLAADQDEPDSIYHLAICYSKGLGVEENIDRAVELFYSAADKGWQPAIEVIRQKRLERPHNSRYTPVHSDIRYNYRR